jgi:hypothetical protein
VQFETALEPAAKTREDAIRAAAGRSPDMVRLVLMTNPNVGPGLSAAIGKGGLIDRPVYVLQYDNQPLPLYGPGAGANDEVAIGYAQVYVDAESGELLYVATFGDPP